MQRPEIEVVIAPDGKVTLTVRGAPGQRCLAYADLVREIVGREDERRLTTEFYAPGGQVRIDTQVRGRRA